MNGVFNLHINNFKTLALRGRGSFLGVDICVVRGDGALKDIAPSFGQ